MVSYLAAPEDIVRPFFSSPPLPLFPFTELLGADVICEVEFRIRCARVALCVFESADYRAMSEVLSTF